MSTIDRNLLAPVLLIACDQAYGAGRPVVEEERIGKDDVLTYFDDTPWYKDPVEHTQARPPSAFLDGATTFNVAIDPIVDDATGFKAVIYSNRLSREVIVAFAGTD